MCVLFCDVRVCGVTVTVKGFKWHRMGTGMKLSSTLNQHGQNGSENAIYEMTMILNGNGSGPWNM